MADPLKATQCDDVLLPLLNAQNKLDEERVFECLIRDYVDPIIRGILRRKLIGWKDPGDLADDIRSQVVVRLLNRLQQFRLNPTKDPINNFHGYVAATTNRVWSDHLRAQYPNRCRLKIRVRYMLSRDPSFYIKEEEGGWTCGLSEWMQSSQQIKAGRLEELLNEPDLIRPTLSRDPPNPSLLRMALKKLFAIAGGPLNPDEVVTILVRAFSIYDLPSKQSSENLMTLQEKKDPMVAAQTSQLLRKMWHEICLLPAGQRTALLLNLRDEQGRELLSFLPITGIATFHEISSVLEMEMNQFNSIWKDLPMDDLKIASLMGMTRQQIINLRKSARERLSRKIKGIVS